MMKPNDTQLKGTQLRGNKRVQDAANQSPLTKRRKINSDEYDSDHFEGATEAELQRLESQAIAQALFRRDAPSMTRPGTTSFNDLPVELVEQIGTNLVTDDIRATARDLGTFRSISKNTRAVAAGSPGLNGVLVRIKDLRSLGNELNAAVVKERLPMHPQIDDAPTESTPVPARADVRVLGPNLKLRSSAENSDLVTKILAIRNAVARCEAIREMTPYLDDISENDRSRLIKEAIKAFGDQRNFFAREDDDLAAEGYSISADAGRLIIEFKARGYLTKEQLSEILDITLDSPESNASLARSDRSRRESVITRVQKAGPNITAKEILESSTRRENETFQMVPYFKEIDPKTLSGLIDHAITNFGQAEVPIQFPYAADVIAEVNGRGYLTQEHKSKLYNITRDNPQLKELLADRINRRNKYDIGTASDEDIAKLRKAFEEVINAVSPTVEGDARIHAEDERIASLQKVSNSLAKSSTMLRHVLDPRERSGNVR